MNKENLKKIRKGYNKNKIIIFQIGIIIFIEILSLIYPFKIEKANIEENEIINIDKIKEDVIETSNIKTNEPKLKSKIALVYDRNSKKIIYEKNGNKKTPMASTTKIMTAIIVIENSNLKDIVTIDQKAANTGGSRLGLKKGDKITVKDLLYGLMLRSGNDAAVALANHIGGSISGFAEIMNKKAIEMKLYNTHFMVPHGLDMDGHYTTAYELAMITDYALNIPEIKKIVGTKSHMVSINGKSKIITNTNELLGNLNGVYGVKTGFTNGAGRCLVTACKRNDMDIITVVLGADTKKIRTTDSIKLIEYVNNNFELIDISNQVKKQFAEWKKENIKNIKINKANKRKIDIELEKMKYDKMAVKNTESKIVTEEINVMLNIEAPVKQNQIIGTCTVKVGEKTVEFLKIYNKYEIKKKNIKDYMLEFLKLAC